MLKNFFKNICFQNALGRSWRCKFLQRWCCNSLSQGWLLDKSDSRNMSNLTYLVFKVSCFNKELLILFDFDSRLRFSTVYTSVPGIDRFVKIENDPIESSELFITENLSFEFTPGVDVMITIFCDFRQFSTKKLAFFSKTNVMIN
jgi:hypothetical protein